LFYAINTTSEKLAHEHFDAERGFLPLKHSGRLKLRRPLAKSEKTFAFLALCEAMTSCVAGANLAMSRADK
jgi:hypothetical protein